MKKKLNLIAAVLTGIVLTACSGSQSQQTAGSEASANETPLTIEEFGKLVLESPKVQVLDVRSPEEFAINHLNGALNTNWRDSAAAEALIAGLDPEVPTFTYSIREGRSVHLAKQLRERGFRQVHFMPGGIGTWVGAGFPIESSFDPRKSLSAEAFQQLIADNAYVLVDLSSVHCPGCKRLHPILDSLEAVHPDVRIVRLELDENLALAKELKVAGVPSLFYYAQGERRWERLGAARGAVLDSVIVANR